MYPPELVAPMREELTMLGIKELTTPMDVDTFMEESDEAALLVINSVCGCSAGGARPAVGLALLNEKKPKRLATVFAGQDTEATARVRELISEYPPSSPMIILLKNKKPVFALERHQIEGHTAEQISVALSAAFNEHL